MHLKGKLTLTLVGQGQPRIIILTNLVGPTSPMLHTKNSEYDQEIPQSQTADNPMAPWGIAAQPSRDTGKTN